jgi:Ca-activated chloride channel homolog
MFDFLSKSTFSFQNPEYLWLLILIPALAALYVYRERNGKTASFTFPSLKQIHQAEQPKLKSLRHSVFLLRLLALLFLTVAFARPRLENQKQKVYAEGIDIMLAIDLSGSMLAEDFDPSNRIEAAKTVAADFVRQRVSDRIGLVVFSGKSFTQCPLTLDYRLLTRFIHELKAGSIEEEGTAIGTAIATATNRLRDSNAKSKVIILLTDGQNNAGEIEPATAADLAASLGIKIYTVGAGTRGFAKYPVPDPLFGKRYVQMKVDVDDATLSRIAEITGGRYFRATDLESLKKTYDEIDKLEKTKVEVETYSEYKEEFATFLIPGLFLLIIEIALANTRFRKVP